MTAAAAAAEPFEIPGTGGRVIRGEVRLPPRARGSVVLVHGFKGFARFAFFPFLAGQLAANGLAAVSFNFSGSGVGEDMETFSDADGFAENTYTRELQDLALVIAESSGAAGRGRSSGWSATRAAARCRCCTRRATRACARW
jgi:alpha-beta hydrolase superfamily lysophospholipase